VLIFMPAAFTFNCPTEIEDAADNYAAFQAAGAEVYIVTTDTHFSHKVWHETSAAVGKAKFPLVGDPTHTLTNAFGVHIAEEGLALRGTFIINPDGVIKTAGSAQQRNRPRRVGNPAQAQGRPVHRRQPRPGVPGQVEGRRQDAGSVHRPGRQDLMHPPPKRLTLPPQDASGRQSRIRGGRRGPPLSPGPITRSGLADSLPATRRRTLSTGSDRLTPFERQPRTRAMLDDSTKGQLAAYFERITQPIELIASLDDSQGAADIRELITEIAAVAPAKISTRFDGSSNAAVLPDHPRRPRHGRALRRPADGA
jgi:peroxiredoxin